MNFVIFAIFGVFGGFEDVIAQCHDRESGLDHWSDANLWDGQIPGPGSVATIETSVLLDVNSVTLSKIEIVGNGRLIISDQIGDVTITADGILVKDFGSLIIGSVNCRFNNTLNIRLTGSRTADRSLLDGKGEKFIAVEDQGTLQIYGQDKRGWTRLSGTVERWSATGPDNIIYSHTASELHFETDRWYEGLAMYVFDECSNQPKYYRAFAFNQNGNTPHEQWMVDQMASALGDVQDKDVVAIATQRRFTTTADLSNLFYTLEAMSGKSRLALRDAESLDPYALVFQKGGASDESYKPMIGTDVLVARASIVQNERKVTAVSKIMAKDWLHSTVDFHILSETVGFPTITVVDDISSWQPGDEIIVTATDFSMHHTEVRTIREIIDAHTLRLSAELDYRHFGKVEDGVDMRAEVGLLTRNIKIQGVMERGCPPNNENCDEFDHDTYGAHVKIFGFTSAHIEGVELTKVGQAFDNGFYPVHFHMCKDISGKEAVIKSNSFHNTYARATTIHGTWGTNETHPGVQILGNVAYDITGHCYFTEDGAEKYTVIDGNLGAYIKNIQTNGFETDRTGPTIFWITNPLVKLTNNAGAGSKGFGIWYVFPEEPVGPSQGLGAFQRGEAKRTPLWLFDNNVMHSMEQDGMRFDDILVDHMGRVTEDLDYMPLSDPFDENSEPVKAQLSRLTCYKNFHRNTWLQAGWFELMQYSSAESRRGLQNAKDFKHDHHTFVKKSIFVGRSRENYEDEEYPDAPDILHYYGVIHYEDLFYMDQTWFNGFETTDKYAGGAFGFFPELKFGSFSSNTTDIRFGFVDKADGSGGNRILDGLAHVGQFVNKPADPTATFRNGDSSLLTCPDEEPKRHQVLMPHSYTATDECEIRNNWGMIACENNYGMIYMGAEGRGVRMNRPVTQAKRMNRLNGSDVAYEDHTGRDSSFVSNVFTTALGSDKYYYQFQFTEDFPRKATFYGIGMDKDNPVVFGICLPVGLQLTQMHLLGVRPPDIVTPFDGWIIVNSLDELFEDDTMTSLYVDGRFTLTVKPVLSDHPCRTAFIRFTSSLERDRHWDKLDNTHCPSNKCPYFQVEITAGDFDYTPCFTVPPDEQSKTMTGATMKSMTCDLPASTPDANWGAGDASREVIQGGWGDWSSWTECCGDEVTTRRRVCDNPPPKGGADCPGDTSETMTCPVGCPVNGEWSQWSRWSGCFCDGVADRSAGAAVRTRTCNVDHEGQFCWGSLSEHKPCFGGC